MSQEKKHLLKIGELAKRAGVTVRTIRYYEELGLITPTELSAGGFRFYSENDLNRILFIKRFKDLGLPLEEIQTLILGSQPRETKSQRIHASYSMLENQLKKINDKITDLQKAKEIIEKGLKALDICKKCSLETCEPSCKNKKAYL
ncbi:helix-turn-helix domain-containing protein [Paradesulfitobacterium aromaticivorans]